MPNNTTYEFSGRLAYSSVMQFRVLEDLHEISCGLLSLRAPEFVHGTCLGSKEKWAVVATGNVLASLEVSAEATPQRDGDGVLPVHVFHRMNALRVCL